MALAGLWNVVKAAGTFAIPIPVWLILSVWGAWEASAYWDKTSAVRDAVERRVEELVTGVERTALEERVKALTLQMEQRDKIIERERELREIAQNAVDRYAQALQRERAEATDLQEQIDDMLSAPLDRCVVDPSILNRLRDR